MNNQKEFNSVIRFRSTDEMKSEFSKVAKDQGKKGSQLLREIVGAYVQSYATGCPDMLALRNQREKNMQEDIANHSREIENLTGRLEGADKQLAEHVEIAQTYIEHSAQFAGSIRNLFRLFHDDIDVESTFWNAGNDSPDVINGIHQHVVRDIKRLKSDNVLLNELVGDIMKKLDLSQDKNNPYDTPAYIGGILQGHENLLKDIIRKAHIGDEGDIPKTSKYNALRQVKRLKECKEATKLYLKVATVHKDRTSKILACICRLFVQTDATLNAMGRRNWWQRLFNKVVEVGEGDIKIAEAKYESEVNAVGSQFDAEYREAYNAKKEDEDVKG